MPDAPDASRTIGITGTDGLLGWHLRAYLHGQGAGREVRCAPRSVLEDEHELELFARGLDVLVHMAGMNRGPDEELRRTNISLVERVIAACDRTGASPHVVFSSSTHTDRNTAYGRSKVECARRLEQWCGERGAPFTNLLLPNVFGEFGKPFHNSVVSTFCHQLACGEQPEVHVDGTLELLHAQKVAELVVESIAKRQSTETRPAGHSLKVSGLLAKLQRFTDQYCKDHVLPDLRDDVDLPLFNTLRSYLFPRHYPVALALRADNRGYLFEGIKTEDHGQAFVSWTKPGITRGNHYHRRKIERFLVLQGQAVIRLRKLFSRDVVEFHVEGNSPQYIDMPTFHTHNIVNVGNGELITMFWSNEIFDPTDSDTFPETVSAT